MKCIQEIRRNYMLYGQPAAEEIVIPVSDDAEQGRPQSEMDTDAVGQARDRAPRGVTIAGTLRVAAGVLSPAGRTDAARP